MPEYAMPTVGDVIAGKYRLEKIAGEGGMGVVYVAEHLVLRQRVAVKVLHSEAFVSDLVVERFAREAQAAARIGSEHVARVMDAGSTATGAPFLVMEYLEGCDLQELLHVEGPLPVSDVADYMLQALEALAHAHAVGIVHRDLKPANLYLACRLDGGTMLKVLDFGISKAMTSQPEDKVLTGQAVLGSPVYMSPEQLRNAKDIDGRADLWSLGVVAYELLVGKPPFDGEGVGEIFAAILENDAETVYSKASERVPRELSEVIAKCLQRKREDRWASAAELARAVRPFGSGAFDGAVERAEQVLSRAKVLAALPSSTARVSSMAAIVLDDARAANAEPSPAEDRPRARAASEAVLAALAAPESFRTRTTNFQARARRFVERLPMARKLAFSAATVLTLVSFATIAVVSAKSSGPLEVQAPLNVVAASSPLGMLEPDEPLSTSAPADEPPAAAREAGDEAPLVMDLPNNPTQAPAQWRGAKPGKPQRPKFLNSRE